VNPIILFDGVCNFCNASVNFIMQRDPKGIFHFAPLQSLTGQNLMKKLGLSTDDLDTMVLIDGDKHYTRSSAGLRIAARLNGLWPIFAAFLIVPKFLRDWIYKIIAKNRYRWWGKRETCMVPEPGMKERFIN